MGLLRLNISRFRYYVAETIKLHRRGGAGGSFVQMLLLFPNWTRSLSHTPVEDGTPWVTYAAINFLSRSLTEQMRVFEWGVGGSTIFFAQRAAELVSVEHDCKQFVNVFVSSLASFCLETHETSVVAGSAAG